MKSVLVFILFVYLTPGLSAQEFPKLSEEARFSLATVAPGDEVHTLFGHSALHLYDPVLRIDYSYNFGTFNFDQPNFVGKFLSGRLLYFLNVESYRSFVRLNMLEKRNTRELELNLTPEQRQLLFEQLQINAREENCYYRYDFFYDNCATRIRDVLDQRFKNTIIWDSTALPPHRTLRQLLYPYLREIPWTRFGIDLILGVPADRPATAAQYMYLPDHLHTMFANARIDSTTRLAGREKQIPDPPMPVTDSPAGPLRQPELLLSVLAFLGILSTRYPKALRFFDGLLWFSLGLAGVVITYLWFFTDHGATKINLNLLWALPTHLIVFWRKRPASRWVELYFRATAVLYGLVLAAWFFLPQQLPVAAMPLVAWAVLRGWNLSFKK